MPNLHYTKNEKEESQVSILMKSQNSSSFYHAAKEGFRIGTKLAAGSNG